MNATNHEAFMSRALEAARRGWGDTHPNPMVGALIVENGRVVADGFHARAGEPHAEVMALRNLGRVPAPGATLYVTLEPCSSIGRTPPCTDAILRAGIKHVVVGATDPNPMHAGRGFFILRRKGAEVVEGVLADECRDLNLIFNHWMTARQPLFAAKIATTIDGRVGTRARQSKWITGASARRDAMRWRRLFPAVGVGAGTVLADDPQLTSRIGKSEHCPARLVFDRSLRTVSKKLPQVYTDVHRRRTIVVTGPSPAAAKRAILEKQGVTIWALDPENWFAALREKCASAELTGLFLEGGPTLLSAFLHAGALDYLYAYRAAKILADAEAMSVFTGPPRPRLADAFTLAEVRHANFGDDQLLRGKVVYPSKKS